jgi:hypothetical protein
MHSRALKGKVLVHATQAYGKLQGEFQSFLILSPDKGGGQLLKPVLTE